MDTLTSAQTDNWHLKNIISILVESLQPERIYLFGSRASGTSKQHSDYDIAIEGSSATFRDKRLAKEKLDRELGIYSFDLVEIEKASSDFKKLIEQKGKLIYERN